MPTPPRDWNDPASAYIGNRRVPPYTRGPKNQFTRVVSREPDRIRIYQRYGWFCIRHLPRLLDQPIIVKGRTLQSVWNQYQAALKWARAGKPQSRAQLHAQGKLNPTRSQTERTNYLAGALSALTGKPSSRPAPAFVPAPPQTAFHDPHRRLPPLPGDPPRKPRPPAEPRTLTKRQLRRLARTSRPKDSR